MFSKLLNNLPIRYKLVIACTLLFSPVAILAGVFADSVMSDALEGQISRELRNSTESIRNMVQVSVQLSIQNSLRNIAEKNTEIVRMFHQEYLDGNLTEPEAKGKAAKVLLSQQIAKSGYIYCLDSKGTVVVHPIDEITGQDLSGIGFVDDQVRRKNGYNEYAWKNPEDLVARPKAVWMNYFEPWDWIISVSAYREEFDRVVNINDFRMSIESLKFMESGYSFVLDRAGELIVHPTYQGANVYTLGKDRPDGLFDRMLNEEKGEIQYLWQNPDEKSPRKKIVVFNRIPELNWTVASSAYLDDLYKPLNTMRDLGLLVSLFCLAGGALVAMQISTSITRPVKRLVDQLDRGATGDYTVRVDYQGLDEIGQLSLHFNNFMERLGGEIQQREKLERQMIEADDMERLSIGQDLHDDLAPHLIGIEIMCQTLSKRLRGESLPAAEQVETIAALVADATLKTRALAKGFCPIHRVDEGLGFALQELIGTVMKFYPIKCQLYGADYVMIKGAIAVHIYRITQEAIYNAAKHAEASQVSVTLTLNDTALLVEIKDDGKGLPQADSFSGMGMQIMRFRARMIDASLELESSPQSGTIVRLHLPNKNIENGEALNV